MRKPQPRTSATRTARLKGTPRPDRRARADVMLALYCSMGPERSLQKVRDILAKTGLDLTLHTIKDYSVQFDWVARAREFDEERGRVVSGMVLERAVADTVRHADFGRSMQALAQAAMSTRMEPGEDGKPHVELTGSEIARLGDVGVKIERLASGLATERIDIMSSAMRVVIEDIGPLTGTLVDEVGAAITRILSSDEGSAHLLLAILRDAYTRWATSADRIVDAEFRAYGLAVENARVNDEEDPDDAL